MFVCFDAPGGRALPLGDGLKNKVMRRLRWKRSPGLRRHLCKKIDELLSLKSFLRVYVASLAPKQRCSGRRAARNFPKGADTAASTVIQSTRHCRAQPKVGLAEAIRVTEDNSEGFARRGG